MVHIHGELPFGVTLPRLEWIPYLAKSSSFSCLRVAAIVYVHGLDARQHIADWYLRIAAATKVFSSQLIRSGISSAMTWAPQCPAANSSEWRR